MKARTVALGIVGYIQLDVTAQGSNLTAEATSGDFASSKTDFSLPSKIALDALQSERLPTEHSSSNNEASSVNPDIVIAINDGAFLNATTEIGSDHVGGSNLATARDSSTIQLDSPTVPLHGAVPDDGANELSAALWNSIVNTSNFDSNSVLLNGINGEPEPTLSDNLVPEVQGSAALLSNSAALPAPLLGSASGALVSGFAPSASFALYAGAPLAAPPPAETLFTVPLPEAPNAAPTVMTFGDLGQSPASIVQTS